MLFTRGVVSGSSWVASWPQAVTKGIRADLLVWQEFLESLNGASFWLEDLWLKAELQVCTDATGVVRIGHTFTNIGVWRSNPILGWGWLYSWAHLLGTFPPILISVLLWGESMMNCTVHFWCNNLAVVQGISLLSCSSEKSDEVSVWLLHILPPA